jgi:hypothetical protein
MTAVYSKTKNPLQNQAYHNDSADDLEGYISDDAPQTLKLPESQVRLNSEILHRESVRTSVVDPEGETNNNNAKNHTTEGFAKTGKDGRGKTATQGKNKKQSSSVNPSTQKGALSLNKPYTGPSASTELPHNAYSQLTNTKLESNTPSQVLHLTSSFSGANQRKTKERKTSESSQDYQAVRMNDYAKTKDQHSKALQDVMHQREMDECTFVPKINDDDIGKRRSVSEFLEHQKKFQEKVENKRKKIQEEVIQKELESDGPHKPEICEGTKKILEKRLETTESEGKVHDRLYKMHKATNAKNVQSISGKDADNLSRKSSQMIGPINTKEEEDQSKIFVPQIHERSKNLKRDDKVQNILYKDALRRQQKSIEQATAKPKVEPKAALSSSSKRALAMRFIREFDTYIMEYIEEGGEFIRDYILLNEFLRRLTFLKESEKVDSPCFTPERVLLFDLWYMLHADKYHGVHRRNLLVVLLAIVGLDYQITKISSQTEQSLDGKIIENGMAEKNEGDMAEMESALKQRKHIGSFDENGNYELSRDEVNKIHKMFEIWHLNRLSSYDNLGKLQASKNFEDHSYHPEINESSKNMAQNHREKILGNMTKLIEENKIAPPKDSKITHIDLLIMSKEVIKEKTKKLEGEVREREVTGCTFKPETTEYIADSLASQEKNHPNAMPPTAMGKNRALELYSLAKPRTEKKDKDKVEIEYEKSCDECTFQPNISSTKNNKYHAQEPTQYYAKGVDQSVYRLRSARQERDNLNVKLNERGFHNGKEGSFNFTINETTHKSKASIENLTRKSYANMKETKGSREKHQNEDLSSIGNDQSQSMMNSEEKLKTKNRQVIHSGNGDQIFDEHPYRQNHDEHEEEMNMEITREQVSKTSEDGVKHEIIEHTVEGLMYSHEDHHEDIHLDTENNHEGENENDERDGEGEGEGEEEEDAENNDKVPLLFVDVNLGQGKSERIVIYEGDDSLTLANKFADKHGLDSVMKGKLKEMLDSQIAGLLARIEEEEMNSNHSESDHEHEQEPEHEQENHLQVQESDEKEENQE